MIKNTRFTQKNTR